MRTQDVKYVEMKRVAEAKVTTKVLFWCTFVGEEGEYKFIIFMLGVDFFFFLFFLRGRPTPGGVLVLFLLYAQESQLAGSWGTVYEAGVN